VIERAEPAHRLLHRATEKLAETRTYISRPLHGPPHYVSMMANEHAYVMAIERLVVSRCAAAQYIRVMFDRSRACSITCCGSAAG